MSHKVYHAPRVTVIPNWIGNPDSSEQTKKHLDSRFHGNDNEKIAIQANHNSRHIAAQIIARWLTSGDFPNRMLNAVSKDRAFITEIVQGVARWKRMLEWVIRQTARHIPPPHLKAFLLTGLYQILMMEKMADYAAVNETVMATKRDFSSKQADFVNAVLRRSIAGRKRILTALQKEPAGVRFSHPDVLINRWTMNYGELNTQRLCEWNNTRPNIIIKINTLKPTRELDRLTTKLGRQRRQLLSVAGLAEAGRAGSATPPTTLASAGQSLKFLDVGLNRHYDVVSLKGHQNFFMMPHGLRLEDLPGYPEGMFLVIDPLALNALDLLSPRPGDNVLDACAAPGGKTFLIAEKMRCSGRLVAWDADAERIKIMKSNFQRLQISNFVEVRKQNVMEIETCPEAVCHSRLDRESRNRNGFKMDSCFRGNDIFNAENFKEEQFDRILADVPCTNTGVIRRKPDIRWRFSIRNLKAIVELQKKMLDQLVKLLKSGGILVYSTCSLEPEENELLVSSWLKENPDCRLLKENISFPPRSGTDGGYAAAILKRD